MGGVEGNLPEPVELAEPLELVTTCEIQRSFKTESSEKRILATVACDWRVNLKSSGSLVIEADQKTPFAPERKHRNGFGGPLCC